MIVVKYNDVDYDSGGDKLNEKSSKQISNLIFSISIPLDLMFEKFIN